MKLPDGAFATHAPVLKVVHNVAVAAFVEAADVASPPTRRKLFTVKPSGIG